MSGCVVEVDLPQTIDVLDDNADIAASYWVGAKYVPKCPEIQMDRYTRDEEWKFRTGVTSHNARYLGEVPNTETSSSTFALDHNPLEDLKTKSLSVNPDTKSGGIDTSDQFRWLVSPSRI
ncbi:unnamed protein product [Orchesella dallaii]|uniref:Uncharacterized protein n=1 Tax=Orchesella dallaii TaxID=48710 RepID=A0ABP1QAX7_9HEXA